MAYHFRKISAGYDCLENDDGKNIFLSPKQRWLIGSISRSVNALRFLRRFILGLFAVAGSPGAPRIDNGYAKFSFGPDFEGARTVCERQLAIYLDFLERGDVALTERKISRDAYMAEFSKTAGDPLKHVPFLYDAEASKALLTFGLQPGIIASVSRHLRVLPILSGYRILYSPNVDGTLTRSQLFHVDPEGARQAKLFVAVRPVTDENSPFTFIPANHTVKMLNGGGVFNGSRIGDKFIDKVVRRSEWIKHIGKPGDALLVDTSQCYHFGSRPSSKPRVLLYYSFHDPFSSFHPIRLPIAKMAKRWAQFEGRPNPFTDYILSRRH